MLRVLDIILSATGLILASPLLAVLMLAGWLETGSPLFRQTRVGQHKKEFTIRKFRTMYPETDHLPTHLIERTSITTVGRFLRWSKLDEFPQLWNVLKGEMSIVGPRPCLFCQEELVTAREQLGVYVLRPGITGLSQVRGLDMSTPQLVATTDALLLPSLRAKTYFLIICLTVAGIFRGTIARGKR
jgi:lipopolysaccharide/colanic/teichoic acid biosynthesis glycosyltransferase